MIPPSRSGLTLRRNRNEPLRGRHYTMIVERGARPDALPKPKRSKTALIAVLGITVGLVLGLAALSLR
jgi:hypothetical protein